MTTSFDKFRKLLAAYEDEVQRKQHKMGKRVDPRDEVQPNLATGYCTFLRGQQVVWSPSFEVIGTWDSAAGTWLWGWADASLEPKLRTRVDEVRKQGGQWGIDVMTTESLAVASEQQAWELAVVATAVSRADAMYRLIEGTTQRFLALYEGPPASRSSTTMRALRDSQMSMPAIPQPPALGRLAAGAPALGRQPTGAPALGRQPTGAGPAVERPAGAARTPGSVAPPPGEREPTAATQAEIGQRLADAVPWAHKTHVGAIHLLARAVPPSGPVGSVGLDLKISLRPSTGDPEVALSPTPALEDTLVSLWMRCRDQQGAGFRYLTARHEPSPSGPVTTVSLEW